jgi:limonene-1,2-epoxide hydrolase
MPNIDPTRRGVVTGGGLATLAFAGLGSAAEAAAPPSPLEAANLKLVKAYLATWADPDFDAEKVLPAYFAGDAAIRLTDSAPAAIGPAAGAAAFRPYIAQGQRFTVQILDIFVRGPLVMTSRIDTEHTPSKPDRTWPVVGVFIVKDGKIREWTDFSV